MDQITNFLQSLTASNILDVATGRGQFLQLLRESIKGCEHITGIDIKECEEWRSGQFAGNPPVDFKVMDGHSLQYPNGCFSLVSISNSLHHLQNPQMVVDEMVRVLAPGGWFVMHEMIADDPLESPSGTHTLLHHWWGKIDIACGIFHRPTYMRVELKQLVQHESLQNWHWMEEDGESDPHDPQGTEDLEKIINDYQGRTSDEGLIAEGEQLRLRVKQVGFLPATAVWGFAQKTN